ncbi:methyltransferase domain-containing protein [Legionella impletisoli]|uniref:Methyltransferase type 11 domain-containing protein n=1 Tax=Legionella impletisoli TaxID=343510 RepID=A0A917JQW9_9GAMM|nr:methyltransferase domain-containing protein [Legionella impletisoli]GGI82035.1 hypothetical protein GCM10007966_08270 [Legionella impletisoli]
MLKLNRIRWALRKFNLPIDKNSLVLDVGSGATPYPRADVLLDRLTGAEHRCGEPMMIDRPAVFGNASKMPFRDKAFDFVIASHVLEHMSKPEEFIKELQRVAKAGYIETPNAIFERFYPYDIHCLEILDKDGVLYIHKKKGPVEDSFLGTKKMLEGKTKWAKYMYDSPHMFHTRYYWNDEIKYKISNPEVSSDWIEQINIQSKEGDIKKSHISTILSWRTLGLEILKKYYNISRSKRLKEFNLLSILVCPECHGNLTDENQRLDCKQCDISFSHINGIPNFS